MISLTCTEPVVAGHKEALVYEIDPLSDARWSGLVRRHERASVFHSDSWLQSLRKTYGYEIVAYTTSAPDELLRNALVFCRVNSYMTGRRLVSLPFSDHCDPLANEQEDLESLVSALHQEGRCNHRRYFELRPLHPIEVDSAPCTMRVPYQFHKLDLEPGIDQIFQNFHKSSIQRKIWRAEREHIRYAEDSSDALLDVFYRLFALTRRRHGLPPQPREWFRNLMDSFHGKAKIRIATKDGCPIAAMLTLRHKDTMVYKYGCSDPRFNKLGSVHFLFWTLILEAKAAGLRVLDFGRTDYGQTGLANFKRRWGATESTFTYLRYGIEGQSSHTFDLPAVAKWKSSAARTVMSHLPSGVLALMGQVVYKHIA